ncbi:MAG TPA: sugar ABC transporter substrate-binding protein [Actinocrinis sp.]|uniref:sugar ABC transporter substrate-binding protein n=1 Tax=Actinocrinis sp. TaxID=1920516 RepID=UPI002DDCEC17|nr:sugar ABC transporter substrate-binding protein [Actinocrinis sp.]HEV2345786.1 sugar ABC transporter substrate-binding protein [Actinocrinis sp.]
MHRHRPAPRGSRPTLRLAAVAAALSLAAAGCGSHTTNSPGSSSGTGPIKIGVALTYNNTAFWAAYLNYETQYAQQDHVQLIGPLLAQADAALQNQQIEELVNQGAQAIIVNPETATSLGPAISYANAHHVQLVSVDTIVGVGKVYMVVRASNTLYGQDACAYITSKVQSGYVLDLEGDLASSNGGDRSTAFETCVAQNAPGVKLLKEPTNWTEATAVSDAQNAANAYGAQLKAIYAQWSSPDTGVIPLLQSKGYGKVGDPNHVILISDDGVPFEMCDIQKGVLDAAQSQPANLYAQYALQYAIDAAKGVTHKAGDPGGGAPTLENVTYNGDTNLADPIVAPFVTATQQTFTVNQPVDGLPGSLTSTPVTDQTLWGNVYGTAHGGVCASS